MEKKNDKIAVLVDGDNAQAKLLKEILEEVSKYGKVTIRRIYGDWTEKGMNSWKDLLNEMSFTPIQKFSYTSGKNSTDGALIIDAMDILHDNVVDGFCIVSSDLVSQKIP
ncbi:NYN domain-containing protein [Mucilaginibacter gracilis]|uniref:NYN domain-containing protein n=1 Tax=Mucilaginibacter gracilis TaxID=423350 RepID=A0A495IVE1_9SPHI|nr:NYN domain-containing protein [Mucilaginibacter gracilis]RKR80443.1 NYN domain-containing protein [Mucilaginibacter gracilis]